MKRICVVLIFLSVFLSACRPADPDAVTFYYCRDPQQFQYFEDNSVICTEIRNLPGRRSDYLYMAALYLAGPLEEGLIPPFNKSTRLLSIQKEDSTIILELSEHAESLTDAEFTLSCACFSMTCMDFLPCDNVIITSGSRSITMNRENVVLFDSLIRQEPNGG